MREIINGEREIISTPQSIYDAFNSFIFSSDIRVMTKLIAKVVLFEKIKDIPGDIVECGVFKGSGVLGWLKIKRILSYNSFKKIIGFDFFNTEQLIKSLDGDDMEKMEALFETRNFSHNIDFRDILEKKIMSYGFDLSEFELIAGDIKDTAFDFVSQRPGFKISLLYLDLDLNIPTYNALFKLWDRVSRGGIVVFDEYAYHQWSETSGADRFFEDKKITIKSLDFSAPTAYIIKP